MRDLLCHDPFVLMVLMVLTHFIEVHHLKSVELVDRHVRMTFIVSAGFSSPELRPV